MRHSAFKQTLFYLVMKRSVACLIWLPKKLIFVEEIKVQKQGICHQISKHVSVHDFLSIFFMSY